MHETEADVEWLQGVLDRSYRAAGVNLSDIHGQGRRLTAADLCARLQGPRWLVVATVSSDHRPFSAQVDGTFYRGRFYFGVNDPRSLKARHLRSNQAISATHVPNDDWVVTVHGRAERADVSLSSPGLHRVLVDTYADRYGPEWTDDALTAESLYFRIEPERMFALDLTEVREWGGRVSGDG
ncbi:MAG TPA: pyridoxamine 5'-phosphate oxidase family protein [Acidimicrobiales bacterium]|nr:pyridoxamine 5'-phosphate oxidase family protein [Acidimicrobiales bacterium]